MDVVNYHIPDCGMSRNALAVIRNAGIEPHAVEYLKAPPTRTMVRERASRAGLSLRDLLRRSGTHYAEVGLGDPALGNDRLLDAIAADPILLNRPLVVTPLGVRLCRPVEAVLDLLPGQQGAFVKEDGEPAVDADGRRITRA